MSYHRYLSQLLSGEEPTQIRAKSAAKVLEMINKLTTLLSSGALHDRLAEVKGLDLSNIPKFKVNISYHDS